MAGYIITDIKTKKIVGIAALVTLIFFTVGIIIGFFSGKGSGGDNGSGSGQQALSDALSGTCPMGEYSGTGQKYITSYLREASEGVCIHDNEDCLSYGLPRHYIAYHLRDKTINIDGKLDDDAWAEVPWTEDFVDIKETQTWSLPAPRLRTRAKIRWDATRLYVGAYIEETDLWGVITNDDEPGTAEPIAVKQNMKLFGPEYYNVFINHHPVMTLTNLKASIECGCTSEPILVKVVNDNDFEVLVDVDGSLLNFKQMLINVRNASWDLMYYRSPYDHKDPNSPNRTDAWSAGMQKSVYYDGTINNPQDRDKFWSVEWSFTFEELAKQSQRLQSTPSADEVWFLNFGRAEWNLTVTPDNQYRQVTLPSGRPIDNWWSWNPCGTVNLLLQNRWGLVQFKRDIHDNNFMFKRWPVYKALFDVFDALQAYHGKHGNYIDQLEELDVPPYLFARKCVEVPTISVDNFALPQQFNVTVKSIQSTDIGHIRQDRYVSFN